jgi:L-alanine-DL-glutamate epimerase-like enolase superfamily enzyme
MHASLRNAGQTGVGAMAISALDIALHDLRARLLDVPLMAELGAVRDHVPIYGSGGFTSYGPEHVAEQLDGWVQQGIPRVKIKVGREPDQDPARLDAARAAIGSRVELMVDANGAYYPDTALAWAERLAAEWGVTWFEEPVTQDDPVGLRWVRERAPTRLAIASGEYSWNRYDIARLLDAGSVDVAQADVTRCCGLTELARIDVLCAGACRPLSLHCAPGISAHAGCALTQLRHLEYFHDHVRIESMLFDGVLSPSGGTLRPDPGCSGHGLNLRLADAEQYAVG